MPEAETLPNPLSVEALLNPNVPEFVPSFVSLTPQATASNEEQVVEGKPDEPENWVEVSLVLVKFNILQEIFVEIVFLLFRLGNVGIVKRESPSLRIFLKRMTLEKN